MQARHHVSPEVVISQSGFPHSQNVKAGELPRPRSREDYNLGDIVLGVEYVFQRCRGDADYYDALTVSAAGRHPEALLLWEGGLRQVAGTLSLPQARAVGPPQARNGPEGVSKPCPRPQSCGVDSFPEP